MCERENRLSGNLTESCGNTLSLARALESVDQAVLCLLKKLHRIVVCRFLLGLLLLLFVLRMTLVEAIVPLLANVEGRVRSDFIIALLLVRLDLALAVILNLYLDQQFAVSQIVRRFVRMSYDDALRSS